MVEGKSMKLGSKNRKGVKKVPVAIKDFAMKSM